MTSSSSSPSPNKEQYSDVEMEKKEQELPTPLSDDIQPGLNQIPEPRSNAPITTQEQEWVSGFKLFVIMTAVSLVCLLMLLDTSIIVTACIKILRSLVSAKSYHRPSLVSQTTSILCPTWAGTEPHIRFQGTLK
jgi:hypothetical protein